MPGNRRTRGEMQFYNPPPMRKRQQEREERAMKRLEQEEEEKKRTKEKQERQRKVAAHELARSPATTVAEKKKKKAAAAAAASATTTPGVSIAGSSEECASSDCSVSGRVLTDASSNLDRFLEYTTPVVPAQYLTRTSVKGWRTRKPEYHLYFVLNDLWDSFEECSVYGLGVPLLLNGSDSIVQYYVPYLSGIQLYVDPSRPGTEQRRAGEDSDGESPRETSSDESNDCGAESCCSNVVQSLNQLSLEEKPYVGSSRDESEINNSPGHLFFEYLERDPPYGREPLADKISKLASRFPELRTCRSCDLSPSSWVSIAWYPIYRIPMGPTLQNLEARFLTFHCLSTAVQGIGNNTPNSSDSGAPLKLPLPTFGLASDRFKISDWSPDGVHERHDASYLLQAAENWLNRLQVDHPDFRFFVSHSTTPLA